MKMRVAEFRFKSVVDKKGSSEWILVSTMQGSKVSFFLSISWDPQELILIDKQKVGASTLRTRSQTIEIEVPLFQYKQRPQLTAMVYALMVFIYKW